MAGTGRLQALLVTMAISIVALAGCGDDKPVDTVTVTTPEATTPATVEERPTAEDVNIYVEQVRELIHIGDGLNSSYRDLVGRYNEKEAPAEEVIETADQNVIAYEDMGSQLGAMTVPEGLEEAHEMVIDGFDKWRQMYELESRGIAELNQQLLDQARKLDNEAVDTVNTAIDRINRQKNS